MKERSIPCTWTEYDQAGELPPELVSLLNRARAAIQSSYAPYSGFRVGAAAHLVNGETVIGANMENASFPLCICAEKSCITGAESNYPEVAVEAIAITAASQTKPVLRPISPCGSCRQVLMEKEQRQGKPMMILLFGESGPIWLFKGAENLLPLPFDGKDL